MAGYTEKTYVHQAGRLYKKEKLKSENRKKHQPISSQNDTSYVSVLLFVRSQTRSHSVIRSTVQHTVFKIDRALYRDFFLIDAGFNTQFNNTIPTLLLVRRLHLQPTEGSLHSSVYSSDLELSSK